jgi:hypothetical protein
MEDHWSKFIERPEDWTAPITPSPDDVFHFRSELQPHFRTLLLGVTPALQPFAQVAVDNNPIAVQRSPFAVLGDWGKLSFDSEFDAVIGDGCLNIFQGGPELLFSQAKKVLKKPGGKLVLRIFVSPEIREDLAHVLQTQNQTNFHAFKLRVTQAMANPFVSVAERGKIMRQVSNHPNLDVYEGSKLIYYHPKLSQLPPFTSIRWSHSYELAERCPIVTWVF